MHRHLQKSMTILAAGASLALLAAAMGGRSAGAEPPRAPAPGEVTNAQRALLLLRQIEGAAFTPPTCEAGQEMFTDVPASSPFCPWIEELARRGITGGCTATRYCPGAAVTRAQMSVFIVKSMEACPTLDPTDEMIRVGDVCIDKYEASIWDAPVGGNQISTVTCSLSGQDCDDIYARSVAGVRPISTITWFQAQRALANSGKRLPTNAEWQMAASGTPDNLSCNVQSGPLADTGSFVSCVSTWGAFDMVGNLSEWVADWVPASTDCPGWGGFSPDDMCLAGAATTARFPGALVRGGSRLSGHAGAGPFAVIGNVGPARVLEVGFRGAR